MSKTEGNFKLFDATYSALSTFLVGWHTGAVSLPPDDIILAQLGYPLNNAIFCLHQE
jgi:hypothetical protein